MATEKTETPQLQFVTKQEVGELLKALLGDSLINLLQNRLFYMHYRAKFRPDTAIILAKDINDARSRAFNYCKRWQMRFISVQPFFMDLEKSPDDNGRSNASFAPQVAPTPNNAA